MSLKVKIVKCSGKDVRLYDSYKCKNKEGVRVDGVLCRACASYMGKDGMYKVKCSFGFKNDTREEAHVQKSEEDDIEDTVEEHGCIERVLSEEVINYGKCSTCRYDGKGCEDIVGDCNGDKWQPKEEVEKSCSNCKSSVLTTGKMCPKWCDNYEHFKPKVQQEDKPKKLKYVCRECGEKYPCKLKVYRLSVIPFVCPYDHKAKWERK